MVKNGKIFTPSLGTILAGITRNTVIKMAQDLGLRVIEKKISPAELKNANELFFTGTETEISPIAKIDNILINQGRIGRITKKIRAIYQRISRAREKKYLKWLTFVKEWTSQKKLNF